MIEYQLLLETLAKLIADYREDEIPPRTPELIDKWLQQFPKTIHEEFLKALVHVFDKTYISRDDFKTFLRGLASTDKLSPGQDPSEYWRRVNFLNIQQGGNSQREILEMFDEVLQEIHGFQLADTGSEQGEFVYLDDCVGTGSRVRKDVCSWLETESPARINLHVITPILYAGSYWIDDKIKKTANAKGKTIFLNKWWLKNFRMEDRKSKRNMSDVLWPTVIPNDPDVQSYASYLTNLGHPVTLRQSGISNPSMIFKDESERLMLEQAFLVRGCQIRRQCSNLPESARPLGYQNLVCFGFGSMFIMYRNCPNNCPLALWVEQEDYPALFPRRTNTQTAGCNLLREFLDQWHP